MSKDLSTYIYNDQNIRVVSVEGEPWFVGKDVANILGYSNSRKAIADHVDEEDKVQGDGVTIRDSIGREQNPILINESGLYSLILSSKLPGAKEFKRWVTHEVLPSIRKTGSYAMQPQSYPEALRALADEVEKRMALEAENDRKDQIIADYEPKAQYLDVILASPDAVRISSVAADYDTSAQEMNKLLHQIGLQYKVGGQWLLYQQYRGMGYTQSDTRPYEKRDGSIGISVQTLWTQKGRLLIYEKLKREGILPAMEREEVSIYL